MPIVLSFYSLYKNMQFKDPYHVWRFLADDGFSYNDNLSLKSKHHVRVKSVKVYCITYNAFFTTLAPW